MSKKKESVVCDMDTNHDSTFVAEIVIRSLGMKYREVNAMMTIFGYAICKVVCSVAELKGADADKEMAKFLEFIEEVYATKTKDVEQVEKEIKLN